MNNTLYFISPAEVTRVKNAITDPYERASILADMFRLNTLSMIMEAGSGHIGTSFSCIDIVSWLFLEELKSPNEKTDGSDTFFSSKGHDVPGIYSVMIGLGYLDYQLVHALRRYGGLPGHPDIHTPHIVANTGSLGMGISKARGMAKANRLSGKKGRFFVVLGDGELQEGQIWESLLPTAHGNYGEITVIVDHNKVQSDIWVKDTSDLGDLEQRFSAHGWVVERCNGHNFAALHETLTRFSAITDKPKVLIADTVKGYGVSFMDYTTHDSGLYKFHSGAPDYETYAAAVGEIRSRIDSRLAAQALGTVQFDEQKWQPKQKPENPDFLVAEFGKELVRIAAEREDIVAMDADLVLDTGLIPFKEAYPDRYVECGIAEQDMVSMAGGLALYGKLPVVNSFACFLSTRPNEQIYNNATEETKIIYAGSLAGLLPSGPGHSHQSVRDISLMTSMPWIVGIEPSTAAEARAALRWAVEDNDRSSYIRLVTVPTKIEFPLPEEPLHVGRGKKITEGSAAVVFAYGPIMLNEAYRAAAMLAEKNIQIALYSFPWLNRVDDKWLLSVLQDIPYAVTIDNHYRIHGQGQMIASHIASLGVGVKTLSIGIDEVPVCGQNSEALNHHGLDATSLSSQIQNFISLQ